MEKKTITTVITVRINQEIESSGNSRAGRIASVGRELEVDGALVYSDRMNPRTYFHLIEDPIKALERFTLGIDKLTDPYESQVLDLGGLVEILSDMRYHIYTTEGLWCIDRNPKQVSKEWIEANAFELKYDVKRNKIERVWSKLRYGFDKMSEEWLEKDIQRELIEKVKSELVKILNEVEI